MRTARRSAREAVDLSASLKLDGEEPRTLRGRAVDLSDGGVGLVVCRSIIPGTPVSVQIEDEALGRIRRRRWRGEVVFDRSLAVGRRLGISFAPEALGPAVTLLCPDSRRGKALRLDSFGPPEVDPDGPESGSSLIRHLAIGGLAIDQLATLLGPKGPPLLDGGTAGIESIAGTWDALPGLAGIGAAGWLCRLGDSRLLAGRPAGRAGLGLLLGGLLSSLAHRIAEGHPRPWIGGPGSPAQVLALAGLLLTLGSLIRPAPDAVASDKP